MLIAPLPLAITALRVIRRVVLDPLAVIIRPSLPLARPPAACAQQDRLNTEWREAVDKFMETVQLLQTAELGNNQDRFNASSVAAEYAENARRALEVHRSTHQCEAP